jgi:7-cyano-7-deazaguanine reductase
MISFSIMVKAEGRIFKFEDANAIQTELLETFNYNGEKQFITYKTKEFSAVCPFSGLPDYGKLIIEYIPKTKIIELKSLKYYITSFRHVGIYQEAVTNQVFQDLYNLLKPIYLKISTIYNTRGGIDSVCLIERGEK